jgi:hypothetical protein
MSPGVAPDDCPAEISNGAPISHEPDPQHRIIVAFGDEVFKIGQP